MLCLHHDDADGRCAGAIVRRRFGDAVELREIDYGRPIPWDKIEAAQTSSSPIFPCPKKICSTSIRPKAKILSG